MIRGNTRYTRNASRDRGPKDKADRERYDDIGINVTNKESLGLREDAVTTPGGPVGFELAAACPRRVLSLTILNTVVDVVDVVGWIAPWTMRPFRWPVVGELWAAGMTPPTFRFLVKLQGIGDLSEVSRADINAYLKLAMTSQASSRAPAQA